MRPLTASLTLLALLSLPAFAGDPDWTFKQGQVYRWECRTEFHYVVFQETRNADGSVTRRGATWRPSVPTSAGRGRSRGSCDPQWEVVRLRATVLDVKPDGSAVFDFKVESVSIETRFDDNGNHAVWDSAKTPHTDLPGYRKYEAMVGSFFGATIGRDGSVIELDTEAWPQAAPAGPAAPGTRVSKSREREIAAADAAHDPTPARAWLSLIFASSPERAEQWKRTLRMPFVEKLDVRANGEEPVGRLNCVRSKFKTSKEARERADRARIQTLEQFSYASLEDADKAGHNWFSRELGCTVKAEMSSETTVGIGGTIVSAIFGWEVELKEIGKTGKAIGPELPPGGLGLTPPPVETKEGGRTQVSGAEKK